MRFQFRSWHFAALLIVLAGAAIALLRLRSYSVAYDAPHLLLSLPLDGAVKLSIDVDALRSGGILDSIAGSSGSEEPDYRRFVNQTGFDYRKDLHLIAASFLDGDVYAAVRGRFDWKRLADYARAQQGSCAGEICSMPGSQPNRHISFYLLRKDVLALAVTAQERGVSKIASPEGKTPTLIPSAPVWVSAPGKAFTNLNGLPDGSHILSPLAEVQEASFSVRAADIPANIRLDAACSSPEIAAKVVTEFTATTDLLRRMLQREKLTPNPGDLSGVLVAGRFQAQATHVIGTWPIEKRFFDSLLQGEKR